MVAPFLIFSRMLASLSSIVQATHATSWTRPRGTITTPFASATTRSLRNDMDLAEAYGLVDGVHLHSALASPHPAPCTKDRIALIDCKIHVPTHSVDHGSCNAS
ncbi:hypothetical protein BDW66DRAFT_152761 [Aspergillus desertorum]